MIIVYLKFILIIGWGVWGKVIKCLLIRFKLFWYFFNFFMSFVSFLVLYKFVVYIMFFMNCFEKVLKFKIKIRWLERSGMIDKLILKLYFKSWIFEVYDK